MKTSRLIIGMGAICTITFVSLLFIRHNGIVPSSANVTVSGSKTVAGNGAANLDDAVRNLQARIARCPKDASLHFELSALYRSSNMPKEAIYEINKAIELGKPEERAFYFGFLADMQLDIGNKAEALKAYREALRAANQLYVGKWSDTNGPMNWRNMGIKLYASKYAFEAGKILQGSSRYKEAEQSYERALVLIVSYCAPIQAIRNQNQNVMVNVLDPLELRNKTWLCLQDVQDKLKTSRPSRQWVSSQIPAFQWSRQNATPETEKMVEDVERCRVNAGPALHGIVAGYYLQSGQFENAVIQYLAQIEKEPDSYEPLRGLGYTYVLQGRLDEAIEAYDKAIVLGDDGSKALVDKVKRARTAYAKRTRK